MFMQTRSRTSRPRRRPATPRQAARARGPIDALLAAGVFRALGDPTRVALLACAAKCARPCSVSELAACCSVDLSVVSRHLKMLERAGLLLARREGQKVLYTVRYTDIADRLRTLADEFESCAAACTPCCGKGCGDDEECPRD